MGCIFSSGGGNSEEAQRQIELENSILKDRLEQLFTFKILILGAGESGKSTVVKQLRSIHNRKLTEADLQRFGTCLHQNAIDCIKALLTACQTFGYEIDPKFSDALPWIDAFQLEQRLDHEQALTIKELFDSEAVQNAYARRNEFWILDACNYYMQNLERFAEYGFTPTEEDVVMSRVRTTGIHVSKLTHKIVQDDPNMPDSLKFEVVDVGGQRSERKKWIHCFDNAKAILFIVNLAGYNQVLFEDPTKNRMHEALDLFSGIVNNRVFIDTPIHLFLNKKDLFEKMILETDMKHIFPNYTGGKKLMPALDFIEEQFKSKLPPGKQCSIKRVAAAVKKDIKWAFEDVKNELYDTNKKIIENEIKQINSDTKRVKKGKYGANV